MKLTEQQLSQLFQDNTRHNQCDVNVGDCLTGEVSDLRLKQAESIIEDRTAAQSAAMASHFKRWSEQVAHDLKGQSQQSLSNRLTGFVKNLLPHSPKTVTAMAAVFSLTAIIILASQPMVSSPVQSTGQSTGLASKDVINSLPFEGHKVKKSDRLSQGGFDAPAETDQLFNANFS